MCYLCCDNDCTIDCANNVGGHCKYMDFAETHECDPDTCECKPAEVTLKLKSGESYIVYAKTIVELKNELKHYDTKQIAQIIVDGRRWHALIGGNNEIVAPSANK